jgi:D-hexose-6-phosphate mutarotase
MPRSGYKEGDWRRFVCVEPANNLAEDAITLEPGESHELKFAVSVE